MINWLKNFFAPKPIIFPMTRDSVRWDAERNRDVIRGYELCVAMQVTLPKRLLQRHGEIAEHPLNDESQSYGGKAIWLPIVDPQFDLASDVKGRLASPMGPIDDDGGKLLPYLIRAREIIEAPFPNEVREIDECLRRVERLRRLSANDPNTSDEEYFRRNFGDDENALLIVIDGAGIRRPRSLLAKHIIEAHTKGFRTISSILSATDEQLLSIKGIGKARLKKIRAGE